MTSAEPSVSVDAVAAHIGVAEDSVYRWIHAKGLPAHRVGKLWKFKLSEVDAWVRAGGANQARTRAKPVRRTTTRKTK
jgi:excisionase family DNA binding protein